MHHHRSINQRFFLMWAGTSPCPYGLRHSLKDWWNRRVGSSPSARPIGLSCGYHALFPHKFDWQATVQRTADDCPSTVTQMRGECQATVSQRGQSGLKPLGEPSGTADY